MHFIWSKKYIVAFNLSFEELTSSDQQLTFSKLSTELIRVMGIEQLTRDILKTLELYSDQNGFNNAAALLADNNHFKGIDIIRFGDSIDEIMERKSVDKIPEKAFREAVANALVHRMWDIPASIKISMYPDKIEISSPGGLPAGLSEDEYLNGQISLLRNPIIGNVFFRLKYIEKFGTGIMRINYAYKNILVKPEYRIFSNLIRIILPVIKSDYKLNEAEKRLINILTDSGSMTRNEVEKAAEMEKSKTIRILNGLIDKNIIQKKGMGRATKYELK